MITALYYPLHQRNEGDLMYIYNNRGFLYADGFFETMRFHNGRVLFFKDHTARIIDSFRLLHLNTDTFNAALLEDQISEIATETRSANARIRLTFFRVGKGYYTPDSNDVASLIMAEPLQSDYQLQTGDLNAVIYKECFKSSTLLAGIKSLNSGIYTLAGIYAKDNEFEEALILNEKGYIAEAVSSNIFIVKNHQLLTPPLTDGCVDGIMRKQVIDYCLKNNISVKEPGISEETLLNADEVFLTNVGSGIRSITRVQTQNYKKNFTETIFKGLLASPAFK